MDRLPSTFDRRPRTPSVGYTLCVPIPCRGSKQSEMTDQLIGENNVEDPGERAIRRRLVRIVMAEFALLMGIATIQGFWPGGGVGGGISTAILLMTGFLVPLVVSGALRGVFAQVATLRAERDELRELYGRARHESLVDALTGLGNHRAFQEELARQLEAARRSGTSLALLLMDVDELKRINDEAGHAAGDQLLATVGHVASVAMRRADRAFRVGGDEFAMILVGAGADDGVAVGRRILASALGGGDPSAPIEPFSVSIGVSAIPSPSADPHSLYRDADAALYWCKRHGRTSVVAFDPGRHGRTTDERSVPDLAAAVTSVIESRHLTPVYQPIVSLVNGHPIGFEGLVRLARGASFADPSSLFAAADVAGRSVELDLACLTIIADGIRASRPGTYLSVNVSPRTLESDLFHPSELMAALKRGGIHPSQVVLEMTEREAVEDLEQLRRNVAACRQAGIRIAADDVGAGNAGLRLLSEIQFDILKVDLALVQGGIVHDPSYGILRALQDLAARWNATLVAEGVETPEQLAVVRRLKIGAGQGFLLGRPGQIPSLEPVDLDVLCGLSELDGDPAFPPVVGTSAA
jgi:diguanylate cyclase (GGDEF)-like protein